MEHIAATMESVLQQDYPFLEYIVVDGGSTDGTMDIVRAYQGRSDLAHRISLVISEPDRGMYDAVAKGFARATGEVFCYLNADDLFECGGLRSVGVYFARHPKTDVIYHEDTVLVNGWKFPNIRQPVGINTVDLLNGHILFQDGIFWRRAAYAAVGGLRRDLKLAGDFDLWLRLSVQYKLIKIDGHVSSFRIRNGQLSSQATLYAQEMQQSISQLLEQTSLLRRCAWAFQKPVQRVYREALCNWPHRRLFFPIDFKNFPPPEVHAPTATVIPQSPIDGKPVERFLFSSPDTRFGGNDLNHIYLDARHGIVIIQPELTKEALDSLYRVNYSAPGSSANFPVGTSPYRNFNGMRIWEKLLFLLPIGDLSKKVLPSLAKDNTLIELVEAVKRARGTSLKAMHFLDTGCFEGHLLDQIRSSTDWHVYGLEPNQLAADVARSKGHFVWCGHADSVGTLIPKDQKFDVIYLGQSLEHFQDPAVVLEQLQLWLALDGVIVVSTPNLNSREINWFGPTWAHWHPPYHRYIFSKLGLFSLARKVNLLPAYFQTHSNPYWTALSLAHNQMGLSGSASHAVIFDRKLSGRAQRIHFWKSVFWNPIGQGDYCIFAMKRPAEDVHTQSSVHVEKSNLSALRWSLIKALRPLRRALQPRLGVLRQHSPIAMRIPSQYKEAASLLVVPKISIVTPSLNQSRFIRRTLRSVLEQGYPNLEFIVKDGGSSDGTADILEEFSKLLTRCESTPDTGQSNAINIGFSGTSGEIMGWLNSDDLLTPGALAYIADYFCRNPEVDVIYGHRVLIDQDDQEIGRWILPAHSDIVLSWEDFVPQETMFWRRRIWDRVGGQIDETFRFAMDWDLLLRFRDAGAHIVRVPRFIGAFRVHDGQKTSTEISSVGFSEMNRLRQRILGRIPTGAEIQKAVRGYRLLHLVHHAAWRISRSLRQAWSLDVTWRP